VIKENYPRVKSYEFNPAIFNNDGKASDYMIILEVLSLIIIIENLFYFF